MCLFHPLEKQPQSNTLKYAWPIPESPNNKSNMSRLFQSLNLSINMNAHYIACKVVAIASNLKLETVQANVRTHRNFKYGWMGIHRLSLNRAS